MRCKPGDLAIVVGAVVTPGLRYRLVIVEKLAQSGDEILPGMVLSEGDACWWCRPATANARLPLLLQVAGQVLGMVQMDRRPLADEALRPIRPQDGEDESLTWSPRELQHG